MHFRTTYEILPWLRCKSGAKEHLSHLSHNNKRNNDIEQKNWKPCWVRFPGSEKLGASRNGRMERNFPVIPIFRNFRPTSRGTPKISEWNSGKCLFHSLPNPEFPEFLVEWKAPQEICAVSIMQQILHTWPTDFHWFRVLFWNLFCLVYIKICLFVLFCL